MQFTGLIKLLYLLKHTAYRAAFGHIKLDQVLFLDYILYTINKDIKVPLK